MRHPGLTEFCRPDRLWLFAGLLIVLVAGFVASASGSDRRPNFVIVMTDDQGYSDVGCFGAVDLETPNLDRLAAEGMRFTDFYVPQAACSASRAALLTGCYPNRIGIVGSLWPESRTGLNPDEWTIPEILRTVGYATALFGKWHLGNRPEFLPTRHGFDEFFGLPYSNDMWPLHPTAGNRFSELFLLDGERIVDSQVTPDDQKQLTLRCTERAIAFIERHETQPFFLLLAHPMPHVPLFVSDRFRGKSQRGLYGDVIFEIDWSTGQILETLKRLGLDQDTLIFFLSDNGPWLSYGDHAGSALPLREGKGTTWEGGVRVPAIARWPGHVPAGTVCREVAVAFDLLPTLTCLANARLPRRRIDGANIWPLLSGKKNTPSPHKAFFYYWGHHLQAVRSGRWKLHFPHSYRSLKGEPGHGGQPAPYIQKRTPRALYDLAGDVGESRNVLRQHPEIVARLRHLADAARDDLGDSGTLRPGTHVREPGRAP